MSSVKASLLVVLRANDVVVAEAEDPILWQRVLTAINSGKSELSDEHDPKKLQNGSIEEKADQSGPQLGTNSGSSQIEMFAQRVGLSSAIIQGGCSPTNNPPYITLNPHCWEEMKKQLPNRGPGSLAPVVAAATMLALWFNAAGLGNPTQAQAQGVLATISLRDPNSSRSIRNATWIQTRSSGQFVINPAEISKAVLLTKCFCSKDWKTWREAADS